MKIEFDLPEFEKEIKVEITIRKDGEVVYTSSSSTSDNAIETASFPAVDKFGTSVDGIAKTKKSAAKKSVSKAQDTKPVEEPKKSGLGFGGNMMGMEF